MDSNDTKLTKTNIIIEKYIASPHAHTCTYKTERLANKRTLKRAKGES